MLNASSQAVALPTTFEEFLRFEPNDGYKYEWNDGELIRFSGMKRKHLQLIKRLNRLFIRTAAHAAGGELICEQDVMLTGIQMRCPDIAYFSDEQIRNEEDEPIPAFCIEIISPTDESEKVEAKRIEYFRAGVQVVWHIFPENKEVYIYTSRKTVQICSDDDTCSAHPVLNDFAITVNELLA
ncbi:Uma2 family endonuclease [Spirosoma soli]|uniref:Uma2 family endonuclease n=1 Tax=Spirosoma soli TaxID=1770529 RepID=A0ABW5LZQ2_9BACT